MNKMKKILAVLCIAIAVVMCLPGLKFLTQAMPVDYQDFVEVDYGGNVTLTPDLTRLPADFKVGEIIWEKYGESEKKGKSYTLTNVTKPTWAMAYIHNEDNTVTKVYDFTIKVKNDLKASSVGGEKQYVAYGKQATLEVKASCKRGSLTYEWGKGERENDGSGSISYSNLPTSGNKLTTEAITGEALYLCTVKDEYGNGESIYFTVKVDNKLSVKAVGDTAVSAPSGEKITLKVKASCKTGKLTYQWEDGKFKKIGTDTSITVKAPKENYWSGGESYSCTVTDQYGNTESVSFYVRSYRTAVSKKLDKKKAYIICGDDEVENIKKKLAEKYPDYTKNIGIVNLLMSASDSGYLASVKDIIKKNPDVTVMVYLPGTQIDAFASTGLFMDLGAQGLADAYSQSYPYTRKAGTYKGKLVAMAPYAAPGTFMYDPDIAKKVLGTSDPDKIQKMIGTADGYLSVAAKLKKAGYYMTSGAANIQHLKYFPDSYTGILYEMAGKTTQDKDYYTAYYMLSAADKKIAKKIAAGTGDNGYDTGSWIWSTEWMEDMNSGKVFGWFSCPWAVQGSIIFDKPMAVCQGPISYCWGGNYLMVKSGKKDMDAVQFLKAICCDPETMAVAASSSNYFPNNTAAVKDMIKKGKKFADTKNKVIAIKGSQNLYEAFDKMARSIGGGSYKISKQKVGLNSNGIVKGSDGKYYYVKKGLIQSAKTGFFKVGKKTYYIKKGVMQNKKTGFVKYGRKEYYVKKGVCSTKNEFVKVGKKTYYLNKGAKNTKTGFVEVGKATYYVKKGLKTTKTAFIKKGSKERYVKNGVWKKSYTGNVTYRKHVYYVKKGVKVKKVR